MADAGARSRATKLEQFAASNPQSPYRPQVLVQRLYAYWEILDFSSGLAAARDVLAVNPDDEDALIFSAFKTRPRAAGAYSRTTSH